jgi:manganese/iron transport system permease protein
MAAPHLPELVTTGSVAIACAVLSVFVVSRRWAFIGEGISHSGFGGAGTAWLLALAFPALDAPWAVYAGVVLFCFATALAIGYVGRSQGVNTDAAIGIFLVASVAWGFLAQQLYQRVNHRDPAGFSNILFGHMPDVSPQFAAAALLVCAAVVATVALLRKEIIYYCFDPAMAEASGVNAGFVHYLLILLVTLTIVVGARVAGSILVTALLVLPGATGTLLSDRLRATTAVAAAVALMAAVVALLVRRQWPFLPTGPTIVLVMFAQFLLAYAVRGVKRRPRPATAQ